MVGGPTTLRSRLEASGARQSFTLQRAKRGGGDLVVDMVVQPLQRHRQRPDSAHHLQRPERLRPEALDWRRCRMQPNPSSRLDRLQWNQNGLGICFHARSGCVVSLHTEIQRGALTGAVADEAKVSSEPGGGEHQKVLEDTPRVTPRRLWSFKCGLRQAKRLGQTSL